MGFISILRKVGVIGLQTVPSIITAYNPLLGALVTAVLSALAKAESQVGPGNGEQKKAIAMDHIDTALSPIMQANPSCVKDVADQDTLSKAIEGLIDNFVLLLNALKVFPKGTNPSASSTPTVTK